MTFAKCSILALLILTNYSLVLCVTKMVYAGEKNFNDLVEQRKISSDNYSIVLTLPKTFDTGQEILDESVAHAKVFKDDIISTIKSYIAYSLETDFWNAV